VENIFQTRNPRTGHYVKFDIKKGEVISHKKSEGPYKRIKIVRARKIKGEV